MWNHFFKHIDILPQNVHLLDGNAEDLDMECVRYEESIKKFGGIELFLGGKLTLQEITRIIDCFSGYRLAQQQSSSCQLIIANCLDFPQHYQPKQ